MGASSSFRDQPAGEEMNAGTGGGALVTVLAMVVVGLPSTVAKSFNNVALLTGPGQHQGLSAGRRLVRERPGPRHAAHLPHQRLDRRPAPSSAAAATLTPGGARPLTCG